MKISDVTYRKVIRNLFEAPGDDMEDLDVSDPNGEGGTDAEVELPPEDEHTPGTQDGQTPQAQDMDPSMQDPSMQQPQAPVVDHRKPVDPKIMAIMKTDSYVNEFSHDDDSEYSPIRIASMDKHDLKTALQDLKSRLQSRESDLGAGLYGDDEYNYLHKLLAFIKQVISLK